MISSYLLLPFFYNRDLEEKREREHGDKKKADVLVLSLRGVSFLGERGGKWNALQATKKTCFYSGKEGHFKRDFPLATPQKPCPKCQWSSNCPQRLKSSRPDSSAQAWWGPGSILVAPITLITMHEPQVRFSVGSQEVNFLLDAGTSFSVLTCYPRTLSSNTVIVQGVSGQPITRKFAPQLSCEWDGMMFSHAFLNILPLYWEGTSFQHFRLPLQWIWDY